jgi:predicted nuclease with TOPRIM domain
MAKARTAEKLQQHLTGAEAANRKHKARIADLERENARLTARLERQADRIAELEQRAGA